MQNETVTEVAPSLESQLPGLAELWAQTSGDPRICIAVLDGPVDLTHPSLRDAALTQVNIDEITDSGGPAKSDHGTHVASVIFGSHDGPVKGIAPKCRGLIVPIFRYGANGALEPCTQERLAKAIRVAARFGANVINISGGQFSSRGEASPELQAAIAECGEDVLIVAAAGNNGCDCLHVPGALPSVLAVGAMNAEGRPLPFSNWGEAYRDQGILAPGERILGASGDGGVKAQSGTSYSTPIVSGVAGLLLSLQQKLGIVPNAESIRNAILESTHGCDPQTETECERVLAGRLNVSGSLSAVTRGANTMQNAMNGPAPANLPISSSAVAQVGNAVAANSVEASACCGGCVGKSAPFVYAIGELQYDFPSVLREQSVRQSMDSIDADPSHVPSTRVPLDFLRHLFGYNEVELTSVKIGDIDEIVVTSPSFRLKINTAEGDRFRLKYGNLSTKDILPTADAVKIDEELAALSNVGEHGVTVTDITATTPSENSAIRVYLVEFQAAAVRSVLEVDGDFDSVAVVEPRGQLRVTISDTKPLVPADVGRQIAFNGVGIGTGSNRRPSVLNSSNAMIVRQVEAADAKGRQVIYVEADHVEENVKLTMSEAHFYIPVSYRVTKEHRPNLYDANAVIWKLNRGQMEVYGIVPEGNFAESAYQELAEFYMNQCGVTKEGLNFYYYEKAGRRLGWEYGWDPCFNARDQQPHVNSWEDRNAKVAKTLVTERSERVAIPGVLQGEVQLITGVKLPAIKPDMRGTADWSRERMLAVFLDAIRHSSSGAEWPEIDPKILRNKVQTLIDRLDHAVRNPGLSPEHRALNHAATRLFYALGEVGGELLANDAGAFDKAATNYELEDIVAKPSEIGYAGSDCWDVEVSFFNPKNREETLLVVSQTIDVNDTIPALTDKPRKFRRR
ncbi:MAG: S8 family serine peptidase [Planctomycetaceae bacterium]|nr:S8 family serine peptidase [Planctomycetaceae bacterium]